MNTITQKQPDFWTPVFILNSNRFIVVGDDYMLETEVQARETAMEMIRELHQKTGAYFQGECLLVDDDQRARVIGQQGDLKVVLLSGPLFDRLVNKHPDLVMAA